MKTVLIDFDDVSLIVPEGLEFPSDNFAQFPPYCGAGEGLGNDLVPETIFKVSVSPACYIHDIMWRDAEPTWKDFHHSNSVFLHNMLSIVQAHSKAWFMEHIRNYRIITFYNAVDTVGSYVFAAMKGVSKNDIA